MSVIDSIRNKILTTDGYLTQDDLTQEQYELVTDPKSNSLAILKLHDSLFGGNLRTVHENLVKADLSFRRGGFGPSSSTTYVDRAFWCK